MFFWIFITITGRSFSDGSINDVDFTLGFGKTTRQGLHEKEGF